MAVLDQKKAFSERLNRINSGKQFEHADLVGRRTQQLYEKKIAPKSKRPKRTFMDKVMVVFAFLCGGAAVFLGRVIYFHLSLIEDLPPAFYDLGGRGMVLIALVLAGLMTVLFHLSTRGRVQALAIGCVVMHFGEAAVAANIPDLWAQIYSPDFAAEMAAQGAGFRLTPSG